MFVICSRLFISISPPPSSLATILSKTFARVPIVIGARKSLHWKVLTFRRLRNAVFSFYHIIGTLMEKVKTIKKNSLELNIL